MVGSHREGRRPLASCHGETCASCRMLQWSFPPSAPRFSPHHLACLGISARPQMKTWWVFMEPFSVSVLKRNGKLMENKSAYWKTEKLKTEKFFYACVACLCSWPQHRYCRIHKCFQWSSRLIISFTFFFFFFLVFNGSLLQSLLFLCFGKGRFFFLS